MSKLIPSIANYIGLIETYIPTLGPGDLAEFGCFNGGHVATMSTLVPTRTVWAFDTFEGLPAKEYDPELDIENPPGKFMPEHDVVQFLDNYPNIKVAKGRFEDTLPTIPSDTKFALVYMDCDYYASFMQVFHYLVNNNHIYAGTVFVFDDYQYLLGTRKAVDEFRAGQPLLHENKVLIYAPTK